MNAKKLLSILIASFILIIVWFLWPDANITNYPPDGDVIVAFGDSLVEGVGATMGNDFVSLLSKDLNLPIINLGVSGNTTTDGLARIDAVLAEKPDIVLLLLGGNDFLRRVPAKETFANLAQIIKTLQDSGAVVVLLGVRGGLISDGYESYYAKLAKEYHTAYVPNVLAGLIGNREYMADSIHPNDIGYAKVAKKLLPVLRRVLQ